MRENFAKKGHVMGGFFWGVLGRGKEIGKPLLKAPVSSTLYGEWNDRGGLFLGANTVT